MLWLIQLLSVILTLGAIFFIVISKGNLRIFRTLIVLVIFATSLYFAYDSYYLKQLLWESEISKGWVIYLLSSFGLFTLALNGYFDNLFPTRKSIDSRVIGAIIGLIGIFAIVTTAYSFLFWHLVIFGALIALSRFTILSKHNFKSIWLTVLYVLSLGLLIGFVLIKTEALELINQAQFVKFTLFSVEYELLMMLIIPNYILLILYNLPWEIPARYFKRFKIVA